MRACDSFLPPPSSLLPPPSSLLPPPSVRPSISLQANGVKWWQSTQAGGVCPLPTPRWSLTPSSGTHVSSSITWWYGSWGCCPSRRILVSCEVRRGGREGREGGKGGREGGKEGMCVCFELPFQPLTSNSPLSTSLLSSTLSSKQGLSPSSLPSLPASSPCCPFAFLHSPPLPLPTSPSIFPQPLSFSFSWGWAWPKPACLTSRVLPPSVSYSGWGLPLLPSVSDSEPGSAQRWFE